MRGIFFGVAVTLLAAPLARAQIASSSPRSSRDDWSATQARTLGAGRNAVTGEAGWPGIGLQYLYGLDDATDVGGRIGFNYGFFNTTASLIGVDLQAAFRRFLMRSGDFDIEAHATPGIAIYGNHGLTLFGVEAPVGLVAAYRVDPRLTVSVGGDVPILLSLTNPFGIVLGPLVGAGGEYKLEPNLALTAKFRVGPEIALEGNVRDSAGNEFGGTSGQFAFQALVGVAYALR
jgi:hypothetical protein